jgi:hypothetical protein
MAPPTALSGACPRPPEQGMGVLGAEGLDVARGGEARPLRPSCILITFCSSRAGMAARTWGHGSGAATSDSPGLDLAPGDRRGIHQAHAVVRERLASIMAEAEAVTARGQRSRSASVVAGIAVHVGRMKRGKAARQPPSTILRSQPGSNRELDPGEARVDERPGSWRAGCRRSPGTPKVRDRPLTRLPVPTQRHVQRQTPRRFASSTPPGDVQQGPGRKLHCP